MEVSVKSQYFFLLICHLQSSMSVTRTCEYCGAIGMPDGNGGTKKLRKCGRCYRVRYCNRDHQKADHQQHKPNCLAFVDAKQEKRDKKAQAASSSSDSSSSEEEEETKTEPVKVTATAEDSKRLFEARTSFFSRSEL